MIMTYYNQCNGMKPKDSEELIQNPRFMKRRQALKT